MSKLLQNLPTLSEVQRARAFVDFSYFMDYDKNTEGSQDADGKHLDVLDQHLQDVSEGRIKRLIVTMPPRHGKSERVSKKFPAWHIGRNPNDEMIIASYSIDLARDFSRISRDTFTNHGDVFEHPLDPNNKSSESWGIAGYRGRITAAGVGGAITGKGARIAIVDDPIKNHKDAQSEVIRETLWGWYQSTLYTRLTPDGAIIVVQTRWHEDDLVGRLLAEEERQIADGTHVGERWTVINFPAIAESDDFLGRDIGEPLWPEYGFGADQLAKIKSEVGSYVFNALYQQRPAAAEGNMLKRQWWKYYEELPPIAVQLITVDAAFKDGDDNDYVVLQVWGKAGPDMYLIDQIRDHMNFLATCQAIRNMAAKYPSAHVKLIEDKANGSAIIQTLNLEMSGIIPVNPEGGKIARVNAVSAAIESGHVYLPANRTFIDDFIDECASFPNGKHDDQVDAMSQALHRFIYYNAGLKKEEYPDTSMEARIRRNMATGGHKSKRKGANLL
ncbi:phage terminase large subunit [Paenibacillus sp. NEAU-GSW1]|uniref:phage terminase large subunit n=1 Tax=Paenibacillus sp. NEAU-GSW1 TaxID=2682486 RepID=UPI0012E277A5|nr:phage terminase large subunit [Paenibacillus sp. NEAU-GSW1]MUT66021.1 phage terminase large subunit [Paenibacillus sp. NEAU-GSW1]